MPLFNNLNCSNTVKISSVLATLATLALITIFIITIVLYDQSETVKTQIQDINQTNKQQVNINSFNESNQKLEKSNNELQEKISKLEKYLSQLENKLNNHICEIRVPNEKMTIGDMVQKIADLEVNNNSLNDKISKMNSLILNQDFRINSLSTALTEHNLQHNENKRKTDSEIEQIKDNQVELQNDLSSVKTKNTSQDKILTKHNTNLIDLGQGILNINDQITQLSSLINTNQTKTNSEINQIKLTQTQQQTDLSQAQSTNTSQDKILTKHTTNLIDLGKDIQNMNDQITKLSTLINTFQTNTNSEINQMKTTQTQQQNDLSQAQTTNASQDKSLTKHNTNLIDLGKDIQNIKDQITQYFTLNNDFQTKTNSQINQLKTDQVVLQNDLSQVKSKNITQLYNNQTNQAQNITDLFSSTKDLSTRITSVVQNLPQITLHTYQSKDWGFIFSSSNFQMVPHPLSSKLTFTKKSLVSITPNMHFFSNGQCFITVLKDKQSITQESTLYKGSYYNSYFYSPLSNSYFIPANSTSKSYYDSVNFVQETIIDIGTYLFEIGMCCTDSKDSIANGLSYTIKVQELS